MIDVISTGMSFRWLYGVVTAQIKICLKQLFSVGEVSVSTRAECLMLWHYFRQSFIKDCNNMAALCNLESP